MQRRDLGRLFVHYQAKIDLATGRRLGHEALIRSEAPCGLLLEPAELFRPSGACMNSLLLHTTRFVVADAARVLARELTPSVSINIAPSLLGNEAFVAEMVGMAARFRGMELEILEQPGPPLSILAAACQQLARAGYRISMDDFGEGESNLIRLLAIQPHEVKLDAKLLVYPEGRRLLPSLARVIQGTGSVICIEGVETEEDHRVAVDAGATAAQGYHYERPGTLGDAVEPTRPPPVRLEAPS